MSVALDILRGYSACFDGCRSEILGAGD